MDCRDQIGNSCCNSIGSFENVGKFQTKSVGSNAFKACNPFSLIFRKYEEFRAQKVIYTSNWMHCSIILVWF